MKIRYQILIIVFVIGSLFIMRDEVSSLISKISSSFRGDNSLVAKFAGQEESVLPGKVETPGALRVVDNLLNINKNIKLDKTKIIEITNNYRRENSGLPALKENAKLDISAEKKLQDMFTNQYFEHISPISGTGVAALGEEAGYKYILIGENLALGNFKDEKSLVDAWMASVGHRVNILNENYTEIGVAVGRGEFDGKSLWMAVQHFGTPRSACPFVNEVVVGTIASNQKFIDELEKDLNKRLAKINRGVDYEGRTTREQIDVYNALINSYNELVVGTKEKINIYNEQVRAFNSCLLSKE